MIVVPAIAEMRDAIARARATGARVGFVPTMGALHDGHLSLVRRARTDAQVVVMSIFVNPLQFGPAEDLSRYPRPVAKDDGLARDAGVDFLFRPGTAEMYSEDRAITVSGGDLASRWEGEVRPGHFEGVLTVVAKLFNIVQPDFAVFGQKDLQQSALVKAMVRDLDMPLEIVLAPIVREHDGLAISSRNRYLAAADRNRAILLHESLAAAKVAFDGGERNARALETIGRQVLESDGVLHADYFAIVNSATFEPVETVAWGAAAIVAARIGTTRLIDNMSFGDDEG
ncbi:MAG: pantoate--beta-alanine ligase [Gemmatimonadaceae bacterium]|nr:pantoate--beta-alanine ligase [Gemmatimonadaceae bacterium]